MLQLVRPHLLRTIEKVVTAGNLFCARILISVGYFIGKVAQQFFPAFMMKFRGHLLILLQLHRQWKFCHKCHHLLLLIHLSDEDPLLLDRIPTHIPPHTLSHHHLLLVMTLSPSAIKLITTVTMRR